MMCRCEPLHSSGYGHMADGIGPEQAVHRTACSWISVPAVLGEEPARLPEITGGSKVGPRMTRGSTGSHQDAADIGVSVWTDHAGQQGHSCLVCGRAAECNDGPLINLVPADRRTGLLRTWDVLAVDLLCTSRDGADDGEWFTPC